VPARQNKGSHAISEGCLVNLNTNVEDKKIRTARQHPIYNVNKYSIKTVDLAFRIHIREHQPYFCFTA